MADTQTPLTHFGAAQLAKLIAQHEVTSAEVVDAHIARIKAVNPKLNAIVVERYDAARRDAREADVALARGENYGPLHGVPITLKESFDIMGAPTTWGTPSRKFALAQANDPYVQRLVEVGAIVIGKTNVPQALLYNETSNAVYGRTNNPWNLKRTCGGSSGGEAAIIAAGGSPLGFGTDVAGSLRYPAAACGIASFKPTAPRMLEDSHSSLKAMQRLPIVTLVGPMAREVCDLVLAMRVLGDMPNRLWPDPRSADTGAGTLGDEQAVDVAGLRVGYFEDDGVMSPSPAVRRAVQEAVDALRQRGAQVVEWSPPDAWSMYKNFARMVALDGAALVREVTRHDRLEPQLVAQVFLARRSQAFIARVQKLLLKFGQESLAQQLDTLGLKTSDLIDLIPLREAHLLRMRDAWEEVDVVVCPPTALPAGTHGSSGVLLGGGMYAGLWNYVGYPAGVVPVTRVKADEETEREPSRDIVVSTARNVELGSAGLPVGVQVVAQPWQDHIALAAMQAIQDAVRGLDEFPVTPVDLPRPPEESAG